MRAPWHWGRGCYLAASQFQVARRACDARGVAGIQPPSRLASPLARRSRHASHQHGHGERRG
eukprot:539996-Pyramimonas_sp.AAC.1